MSVADPMTSDEQPADAAWLRLLDLQAAATRAVIHEIDHWRDTGSERLPVSFVRYLRYERDLLHGVAVSEPPFLVLVLRQQHRALAVAFNAVLWEHPGTPRRRAELEDLRVMLHRQTVLTRRLARGS